MLFLVEPPCPLRLLPAPDSCCRNITTGFTMFLCVQPRLKGILIHTADEAGPADGPDYQFGWGLIDMPKAAAVITSNNTDQLIQENNLTDASGTYSVPVVASGKGPITATICWTDPAGSVDEVNVLNNPARKLVNDLDLRVTGNGNTYMPWVLNRLSPGQPCHPWRRYA